MSSLNAVDDARPYSQVDAGNHDSDASCDSKEEGDEVEVSMIVTTVS
jgi:hypothetical protein